MDYINFWKGNVKFSRVASGGGGGTGNPIYRHNLRLITGTSGIKKLEVWLLIDSDRSTAYTLDDLITLMYGKGQFQCTGVLVDTTKTGAEAIDDNVSACEFTAPNANGFRCLLSMDGVYYSRVLETVYDDVFQVASAGDPYELPKASATTLGGVKIGDGITIDADGKISAQGMSGELIGILSQSTNLWKCKLTDGSYWCETTKPALEDVEEIYSIPFTTTIHGMMSQMPNLTKVHCDAWDTRKVTTFGTNWTNGVVSKCAKLTHFPCCKWITSSCTDMNSIFNGCSSLVSVDVSGWDTASVTNIGGMFNGCSSLVSVDVSGWDTASVTDMNSVFSVCSSLRYITLGENFFKFAGSYPFNGAVNLGLNADGTSNGWLEHLASVAPQITDGKVRTLQLHNNLKSKTWAAAYITQLTNKGYTIA